MKIKAPIRHVIIRSIILWYHIMMTLGNSVLDYVDYVSICEYWSWQKNIILLWLVKCCFSSCYRDQHNHCVKYSKYINFYLSLYLEDFWGKTVLDNGIIWFSFFFFLSFKGVVYYCSIYKISWCKDTIP